MFGICLALNVGLAVPAMTGLFDFGRLYAPQFAIVNTLAVLLVRSELFLRVVYWAEVQIFKWACVPTCLKHVVVHCQVNIGGIHSSCGISALLWLVYVAVLMCTNFSHKQPWTVIFLALSLLGTVLLSCASAVPVLRDAAHELFENVHRYAGWSSLGLLWAFVLLSDSYEPASGRYILTGGLVCKMELWCCILATFVVFLPWLTVRKVPVIVNVPSQQAAMITLPGWVAPGILNRISRQPMYEWHAFATICMHPNADKHVMMISPLGDFTRSLITHPPSCLYVRTIRFAGLAYLVSLYQRVVVIATGTGASPYLSNILQPTNDIHLIWIGRNMEKAFAGEVWDGVHNRLEPHRLTIVDTAVQGRPDMTTMACEAYDRMNAQVVFVGSNRAGTKAVMRGCRSRGIACFGPVWDS